MIGRRQLPELRAFARAEEELPLRTDPHIGGYVVPNGNAATACHRWFKYKEAFSSDLLKHVISSFGADLASDGRLRLLDPFCGVGTSLLSAQLLHHQVDSVGIECNPFSAFVARTKLAWPMMDARKVRALASKLLDEAPTSRIELPRLSSITSGRCISRHMARQVVFFRRAIESLPPSFEREALTLGLASVIEPVSRIRRDGRALRIVNKRRVVFREILEDRWKAIAADIESLQKKHPEPASAVVRLGDGRDPSAAGIEDESIDMILTSPPYPNNIDYNEVYKLELWFLGYAKDAEEFLSLRRSTFRSHPTCSPLTDGSTRLNERFVEIAEKGAFADLMGTVIRRVAKIEKKHRRGRTKVLLGYAYDTWRTLQAHHRVLRCGGRAVYVVGSSLHGGPDRPYLVPTDLMLATLAQQIGFEVEQVVIARGLQRRLVGNHFLRDSVVVLRKK